MAQVNETGSVAVVYTAADLRAVYRVGSLRQWTWLLLIPLAGLLFGLLDGYRGMDLAYEVLPYLLILFVAPVAVYFISPALNVRARAKNGWAEPMSVSFNESGVDIAHPAQTSVFPWKAIKKVVVRGGRLFLFTSPACAIVLPRRVFDSDHQFSEWAKSAQHYWRRAS